jgi:arylsulfatase A-like enzyme
MASSRTPWTVSAWLYTFDEKNADAPSTHKTQYFEMIGDHAIYHDGWILSTKVMRVAVGQQRES